MTTEQEIIISREDGKAAKLVLQVEDGDDLWAAVERTFPYAYDLIDEHNLEPNASPDDWDEKFGSGEEDALIDWLGSWSAVVEEVMPICRRYVRKIVEVDGYGSKTAAYYAALDEAHRYLDRLTCNLAEVELIIRIGGKCLWSWQEELSGLNAVDQTYYAGILPSGARIEAQRIEGIARIIWAVDGGEAVQEISLNVGDFDSIACGADPIAEAWEDGSGNLVCLENARRV